MCLGMLMHLFTNRSTSLVRYSSFACKRTTLRYWTVMLFFSKHHAMHVLVHKQGHAADHVHILCLPRHYCTT